MKKTILIILAAVAVVSLGFAQTAGPKQGGGAGLKGGQGQRTGGGGMRRMINDPKVMDEIAKRLKLTADQKSKWKALGEKLSKDMQGVMGKSAKPGSNGGRPEFSEDQRAKMKKVVETYQADLGKILSKQQMAELQKIQKEMREKMMKERGGRPGGPPPNGGAPKKGGG